MLCETHTVREIKNVKVWSPIWASHKGSHWLWYADYVQEDEWQWSLCSSSVSKGCNYAVIRRCCWPISSVDESVVGEVIVGNPVSDKLWWPTLTVISPVRQEAEATPSEMLGSLASESVVFLASRTWTKWKWELEHSIQLVNTKVIFLFWV